MTSFESFALEVFQGLSNPILVVNERYELLSANDVGWKLLNHTPRRLRGRPLEELLRPAPAKVRTPITALRTIDPTLGWKAILESSQRFFPRLTVQPVSENAEPRIMDLEISPVDQDDLHRLAIRIYENHPEWIVDGEPIDKVLKLVTPRNYILFFHDVTELAHYEEQRQELMRGTLDVVVRTLDHYIRNALTPILGYCDLLKRRGGVVSKEDMMKMSERVARHVLLITALLDSLQTVRDIHTTEPLGADATLIDIEKELKLRLEEIRSL
jgi:nitrogen-specific signal transduction histidine kinase